MQPSATSRGGWVDPRRTSSWPHRSCCTIGSGQDVHIDRYRCSHDVAVPKDWFPKSCIFKKSRSRMFFEQIYVRNIGGKLEWSVVSGSLWKDEPSDLMASWMNQVTTVNSAAVVGIRVCVQGEGVPGQGWGCRARSSRPLRSRLIRAAAITEPPPSQSRHRRRPRWRALSTGLAGCPPHPRLAAHLSLNLRAGRRSRPRLPGWFPPPPRLWRRQRWGRPPTGRLPLPTMWRTGRPCRRVSTPVWTATLVP